ncbi:MAG: AbrB/MazE/SpoVT family DNA-binding domain-containing protein, partial [Anaerolineae bacterium]
GLGQRTPQTVVNHWLSLFHPGAAGFSKVRPSAILMIGRSDDQEDDMPDTLNVQLGQRGVVTLPKALRESYNLQPGDSFTLLDLGGVFVLSPRRSEIDTLADQITQALTEQGESVETMLKALREERERYDSQT